MWPSLHRRPSRHGFAGFVAGALLVLADGPAASAPDVAPGTRFQVSLEELPEPYATPSVTNRSRKVAKPEPVPLRLPEGFRANVFADGLEHARNLLVAPNGDVFLAEPRADRITLLRDEDGDGRAERRGTFADGFAAPHGLALAASDLLVGDLHGLWHVPYRPGAPRAAGQAERISPEGAFGVPSGHWTRNVAVHPDGQRVYVAIGSRGNIAEEPVPRATVQEFRLDTEGWRASGQRTFASGLRNPVDIAFYPGTTDLYAVVNERDRMGDGLVPDYLTRVREGGFYGWPYAYIGPHPQPDFAEKRPDLVKRTLLPDLLFRSHSAPLGLAFYDADAFPPEYRGDAFVGLHGSWNAGEPRGYMVVRVPFADGRPVGHYEAFATGFRIDGGERASVWGRPVGVAVAVDGSLLVADDVSQTVWRISYRP